jgi:chromosome segregation ATPase
MRWIYVSIVLLSFPLCFAMDSGQHTSEPELELSATESGLQELLLEIKGMLKQEIYQSLFNYITTLKDRKVSACQARRVAEEKIVQFAAELEQEKRKCVELELHIKRSQENAADIEKQMRSLGNVASTEQAALELAQQSCEVISRQLQQLEETVGQLEAQYQREREGITAIKTQLVQILGFCQNGGTHE